MHTHLIIKDNGTVDMIAKDKNTETRKTVMFSDIAELFALAIKDSMDQQERWLVSPTLPPNTLAYKESEEGSVQIAFSWGPDVLPFQYEDTLFPAIPFPRLIFCLHGTKVEDEVRFSRIALVAVKEQGMITDETELYRYPFSHVNCDTSMCYGSNELPKTKKLTDLKDFPRYILTTPNGADWYNKQNNMTEKPLRQILEALNNKEKFPYKWLRPLNKNFRGWIECLN